jgi:hypothetical protein
MKDTECEIIEIISPAGCENYFREVAAAWGDRDRYAQINARYVLDMDFDSVPVFANGSASRCHRFK